jgi:hypothetical protein
VLFVIEDVVVLVLCLWAVRGGGRRRRRRMGRRQHWVNQAGAVEEGGTRSAIYY